jgi:hypothetical protein
MKKILKLFLLTILLGSCKTNSKIIENESWKLNFIHPTELASTKESLLVYSILNLKTIDAIYKFNNGRLVVNDKYVNKYFISENQLFIKKNGIKRFAYYIELNEEKLILWNNEITLEFSKN